MFWMFLIPFIVAEVYFLAGCFLFKPDNHEEKKGLAKYSVLAVPFIPAILEAILLLIAWLFATFLMAGDSFGIPHIANVLLCASVDGAVFAYTWSKDQRLLRITKKIAVVAVGLFVLEFTVFGAKSFSVKQQSETFPSTDFEIVDSGISFYENDYIVVGSESVIHVKDLPDWTRCVTIQQENQPDIRPLRIKFFIMDDNFYEAPQVTGHKITSTYGEDVRFCVIPYGNFRECRIEYFEVGAPTRLYSITCLDAVPFSFSLLRYLLLFVGIVGVMLIREFRLAYVIYDRRKRSHRIITGAVVVMCVASVGMFWIPKQELVKYPEEFDVELANPYEQTLDAFESGHAWINFPVDEALMEMEKAFDRVYRDGTGVKYLFDRALYNGRYYSYFGIAPVVTFYYPVYWLTGDLPTVAMTCMFYAPFTVLFMCLALLAAVRLCVKRPNFLLLLLSIPATVALCGVYYCLQFPNQYDVVVASGLCFLSLALWTGMQACLTETKWLRCVLFAVCGIGCVFCVQSRPSMAITAVFMAPLFIGILRKKQLGVKYRIAQALSFAIPVCIGAAATMYYNAIRFSSPLDFGAEYQLTISNVQANTLRLSAIPATIYHYFLQPLTARPYFPFFTISYHALDNYHMYNNLEHTVGALSIPMLTIMAFLLPKVFLNRKRLGGEVSSLQGNAMVIGALGMAAIVAWLDFCLGGVSLRYSFDFMPVLLLASVIVILSSVRDPKRYVYVLTAVAIILSFVIICFLLTQYYIEGSTEPTIWTQHPMFHEIQENAFLFWE